MVVKLDLNLVVMLVDMTVDKKVALLELKMVDLMES
jgi:hypothetical protein